MNRRDVLLSSLVIGGSTAAGHIPGFASDAAGYGPLAPVGDDETGLPLLALPANFRYRSFGWTGDPMANGEPTPDRHDGMAALAAANDDDSFVLIRNHERAFVAPIRGAGLPHYDRFSAPPRVAACGGGTTALIFRGGRYSETVPTLAGTLVNCAGGPTPWGTWLTCEEIVIDAREGGARAHGYVFEVPTPERGPASAVPIVAMGRMKHEAVAVDAETGFVYLTEDNGPSGFYRFRPRDRSPRIGALERGGLLEMLKVVGRPGADLGSAPEGEKLAVEWVPIEQPDAPAERRGGPPDAEIVVGLGKSGPYLQGEAQGGAAFRRLEGCFMHGGRVYFTDTTGGDARSGTLWTLTPGADGDVLECVYVSPGEHEADRMDNICVGPRGGIVMCEDGGGVRETGGLRGTRLVGLGPDGIAFPFCENTLVIEQLIEGRPAITPGDYREMEFAGACYSPRGDRLFVNVQTPGVTFEITGPWERGPL